MDSKETSPSRLDSRPSSRQAPPPPRRKAAMCDYVDSNLIQQTVLMHHQNQQMHRSATLSKEPEFDGAWVAVDSRRNPLAQMDSCRRSFDDEEDDDVFDDSPSSMISCASNPIVCALPNQSASAVNGPSLPFRLAGDQIVPDCGGAQTTDSVDTQVTNLNYCLRL